MPVENNVHHRAPITVADGFGAKPGAAPHKPGPARPTPGNANAPVRPLRDIKPDPKKPNPKRALSEDIDNGLRDIRSGKFTRGENRIATGIGHVVMYLTGKNLPTYDEARRATGEILAAYSTRLPADVMDVVDGVDNYLQLIVIDELLLSQNGFPKALETAKEYVTDPDLNSRSPADRLVSMIHEMRELGATPRTIIATKEACIEAIGKQALKQRPASKP